MINSNNEFALLGQLDYSVLLTSYFRDAHNILVDITIYKMGENCSTGRSIYSTGFTECTRYGELPFLL